MRLLAHLPQPTAAVARRLIYDDGAGAYLFSFDTLADTGTGRNEYYETAADAQDAAQGKYGVAPADWQPIPDPLPHCLPSCIAPIRVKGSAEGAPQPGRLERLINNQWVDTLPLTPQMQHSWTSFNSASK